MGKLQNAKRLCSVNISVYWTGFAPVSPTKIVGALLLMLRFHKYKINILNILHMDQSARIENEPNDKHSKITTNSPSK